MKGVVVCVEYTDLLRLVLVRNMRFLSSCAVITSPQDTETQSFCAKIQNVSVFVTDAFYRHGAKFNKGLAIEEYWNSTERDGWICAWDADILFPDTFNDCIDERHLKIGTLYGPRRRMMLDPENWTPQYDWSQLPIRQDRSFPGYCHVFHGQDPHIAKLPWYDVTFAHAGGGDGYFEQRWPRECKVRIPCHVLHLGPPDNNWFGRVSPRIDGVPVNGAKERHETMETFLHWKGWNRPETVEKFDHERVEVPGYSPTEFRLLSHSERFGEKP